MTHPRRALSLVLASALIAGGCAPDPAITEAPSRIDGASSAPTQSAPAEIPFAASAWPAAGSACDVPGYAGLLGRIEALEADVVRFTLCAPDGAFRSRLAHPALGILDATTIARLAADRGAATSLAGTGPYRIDAWAADNVRLEATGTGHVGTLILRWTSDPDDRAAALVAATVDGIDSPSAVAAAAMATEPDITLITRSELATAYLGFGTGRAFASVRVRRAIAAGLDREGLALALGPGTVAATHTAPCEAAGGCEGRAWYEYNAPTATAALDAARFDRDATLPLHVPDVPFPGLSGLAEAVRAQFRDQLGIRLEVHPMPAAELDAALAAGTLGGLYLGRIASPLPDVSGFLVPLFGRGVATTAASRVPRLPDTLRALAGTVGSSARAAIAGSANDMIRSAAPIVPLVHPGSVAAWRSDVTGTTATPLATELLGSFVPADRRQLAFVGRLEPAGAWCGDRADLDALRLCALVTEGLYGFEAGSLRVRPALAVGCTAGADVMTWTCRLRRGVAFQDGMRLDAGDVLASLVAQWDGDGALRRSAPVGAFAAWDALFGRPASESGAGGAAAP